LCDGGNADATFKENRDGDWVWFVSCKTARCEALNGDYLGLLAKQINAPNGWALKEDPLRWLDTAGLLNGQTGRRGGSDREDPPSIAHVEGWHAHLLTHRRALAYLTGRGLSHQTIDRLKIGYARPGEQPEPWRQYAAFTLPMLRRGEVVAFFKRFWPELPDNQRGKPVKYVGLGGQPHRLYPALPRRADPILCAGFLDAPLGRQHGLPTVASTSGASLPTELVRRFEGRRVAVVYDVGEEEAAAKTVEHLRHAGAREAWTVDLARAGLEDGEDLTDWFRTYGRTAGELRELVDRARRTA
jgi:hypothetical protein